MPQRDVQRMWPRIVAIGLLAACNSRERPVAVSFTATPTRSGSVGHYRVAMGASQYVVGGSEPLLASARAAVVDSSGSLLVLDDRMSRVEAYDSAGQWQGTIGRSGSGPGEFAVPRSIAVDNRGRLVVLDASLRRLTYWRKVGRGWEVDNIAASPVGAYTMCLMHEHLFLVALQRGHLVHEVTMAGDTVRSFGDPFGPPPRILQEDLSQAAVACFHEPRVVVVASNALPQVRGYSALDGALKWQVTLPAFHPILVKLRGRGVQFTTQPGITNVIAALVEVSADVALLQVGTVSLDARSAQDVDSVTTWLIDVNDGTLLGRVRGIPLTIGHTNATLLTLANDSIPLVAAHPFYMDTSGAR